jgi:hypothetical protein
MNAQSRRTTRASTKTRDLRKTSRHKHLFYVNGCHAKAIAQTLCQTLGNMSYNVISIT